MQKIVGAGIFAVGLIALGLWAQNDHAVRIQGKITHTARHFAKTATLDLRADVSGRDIDLVGTAQSLTEKATLVAAFESISGVRRVNSGRLHVLKTARPFAFGAVKSDTKVTYHGNIPNPQAQEALSDIIDAAGMNALEMAQGVPKGDWVGMVRQSLTALTQVDHGTLNITNTYAKLTGQVADFEILDDITAAMTRMPLGFSAEVDLTVPNTAPFLFSAVQSGDRVALTGHVPDFSTRDEFIGLLDNGTDALERANGMPDAHWPRVAALGLEQLNTLLGGTLEMQDRVITLSGTASDPLAAEEVRAAMRDLPNRYKAIVNVEAVIVSPYVFTARSEKGQIHYDGLAPTRKVVAQLRNDLGVAALGHATLANGMPDTNWPEAVGRAALALRGLIDGNLQVSDHSISLHGIAANPMAAERVMAHLTALPDGYDLDVQLEHADDGKPLVMVLEFSETAGAIWTGKAPVAMGLPQVTDAMGEFPTAGEWDVSTLPDNHDMMGRLEHIGNALGDFETASARVTADGTEFTGVLNIGRNVMDTTSRLSQTLGGAALSIHPNPAEPIEGEERLYNGQKQVFRAGVWVREFERIASAQTQDTSPEQSEPTILTSFTHAALQAFPANRVNCVENANALLGDRRIKFKNGSAELVDESQPKLDDIAVFVGKCVIDANMRLEIGGHTDNQGDSESNETLSAARAMAVLFALVDRGIDGDDLSATGFGDGNPIADNETAEGRSENRRTTFRWIMN